MGNNKELPPKLEGEKELDDKLKQLKINKTEMIKYEKRTGQWYIEKADIHDIRLEQEGGNSKVISHKDIPGNIPAVEREDRRDAIQAGAQQPDIQDVVAGKEFTPGPNRKPVRQNVPKPNTKPREYTPYELSAHDEGFDDAESYHQHLQEQTNTKNKDNPISKHVMEAARAAGISPSILQAMNLEGLQRLQQLMQMRQGMHNEDTSLGRAVSRALQSRNQQPQTPPVQPGQAPTARQLLPDIPWSNDRPEDEDPDKAS